MKRTAKYADGWLPYMYTPEQLHDSIEKIKRLRTEYGRDVESFNPGVFIFTATHADGEKGREMAASRLGKQYGPGFFQADRQIRARRNARRMSQASSGVY